MIRELGAQRPLPQRLLVAPHRFVDLARRHHPSGTGEVVQDGVRNVGRLRCASARHRSSSCYARTQIPDTPPRFLRSSVPPFEPVSSALSVISYPSSSRTASTISCAQ